MKSKNLHVSVTARAWLPAALWALTLFGLSSIAGSQYPAVSFQFSDKLVHVGLYAVLGALTLRGFARATAWSLSWAFWASVGVCVLYGATDEVHQLFVPHRSADVGDLLADAVGAVIGAGLAAWRLALRR